jgi:circadian clock protein KaiC
MRATKAGASPAKALRREGIRKSATGIRGLDEVTGGGLPAGRATLVCGSAGCGKTLMSLEFLVRGAEEFGEPGVFIAFEETGEELAENVRSLGFDLDRLIAQRKIAVDYIQVERSEIEETGEYDLEALFIRLDLAARSVGAKRVVLDTLEALFGGLSNQGIIRAELRRLFRWLKDRGLTAVITGERGEGELTRHGLEEYVSDCVILLDHRVSEALSTRRLRIVKYRGSVHGTNEYPFLIDENGISVLPITSLTLGHAATGERISTGIPRLDEMLGGEGYYRGSSVLISGTAGIGKTSLAALFVNAACQRRERCLYFSFEESERQIVRNMASIGMDLDQWLRKDLLHVRASRPSFFGLEAHLVSIHRLVNQSRPRVVVIDPLSAMLKAGAPAEVRSMVQRLVDYLKGLGITALFTSLNNGADRIESTDVEVSSIIDTWLNLRDIEVGGERNRGLYVLKSRGMPHSNQIREFILTSNGVDLLDVYSGPEGVLTGSLRLAQEARERAGMVQRQEEISRKERELERRRGVVEAQILALRAEFASIEEETHRIVAQDQRQEEILRDDRTRMSERRGARAGSNGDGSARPRQPQKGRRA